MEYKELILEKKPPIAYITLNRPEKLNTLSPNIMMELNDAALDIWDDHEIRTFVVKAAGPSFCAGFDVSQIDITRSGEAAEELGDDTTAGVRHRRRKEPWSISMARLQNPKRGGTTTQGGANDWMPNIWNNPKISIAQVHGYCLGAGLILANACDLVVASEDALFAYPPIRYGSSVIFSILPPWFLGVRKLKEMAYTGDMIDSHDAYNCGLVNRVMPIDELEEEVNRLARVSANVPYPANELSKIAINNYVDTVLFRDFGIKWAQSLNAQMEASTVPGNIWIGIADTSTERGGAGRMFSQIREKFLEGDTLARENAKKFSQKKAAK
jgi:enoyl-CoA hydratase